MAKTFKNLFGDGYTTHEDDGSTYRTTKDAIGDGYTTHGDDGTTYRTTKDVIGDGYTTHGDDGTTYRTTKDVIGDGYTTHGNETSRTSEISGGVGGDIGGGIALVAVGLIVLLICNDVLSAKSYICVAGFLIAPKLSGICERLRISGAWCSGVLFCFAAFGAINSIDNDVTVVAGTQRGGEGLITLLVLLLVLIVGIVFAIFGLGGSGIGILSSFVLVISLAWSYLNMLGSIPYTHQMMHFALGLLCIFAIIDQIKLLKKK